MSKLHAARVIEKHQGTRFALPEQVEVPLRQLAAAVKEGLLAFSVGVGLQVMALMMEEELNESWAPRASTTQTEPPHATAPSRAASSSVAARSRSHVPAPAISMTPARSSFRPTRISPRRISRVPQLAGTQRHAGDVSPGQRPERLRAALKTWAHDLACRCLLLLDLPLMMWTCTCERHSGGTGTAAWSVTCSWRTTGEWTARPRRRCWSTSAARTASTSTGSAAWRARSPATSARRR